MHIYQGISVMLCVTNVAAVFVMYIWPAQANLTTTYFADWASYFSPYHGLLARPMRSMEESYWSWSVCLSVCPSVEIWSVLYTFKFSNQCRLAQPILFVTGAKLYTIHGFLMTPNFGLQGVQDVALFFKLQIHSFKKLVLHYESHYVAPLHFIYAFLTAQL